MLLRIELSTDPTKHASKISMRIIIHLYPYRYRVQSIESLQIERFEDEFQHKLQDPRHQDTREQNTRAYQSVIICDEN